MFNVIVEGAKLGYAKRVKHGAPYFVFSKEGEMPAKYSEQVAKGWVNTFKKYGYTAEMVET